MRDRAFTFIEALTKGKAMIDASFPPAASNAYKKLVNNVMVENVCGLWEVDSRDPEVQPFIIAGSDTTKQRSTRKAKSVTRYYIP